MSQGVQGYGKCMTVAKETEAKVNRREQSSGSVMEGLSRKVKSVHSHFKIAGDLHLECKITAYAAE